MSGPLALQRISNRVELGPGARFDARNASNRRKTRQLWDDSGDSRSHAKGILSLAIENDCLLVRHGTTIVTAGCPRSSGPPVLPAIVIPEVRSEAITSRDWPCWRPRFLGNATLSRSSGN